jgi:hypothetical protein
MHLMLCVRYGTSSDVSYDVSILPERGQREEIHALDLTNCSSSGTFVPFGEVNLWVLG